MSNPIHIEKTQSTPEVILDKQKNIFVIRGDILPEDSYAFFLPIYNWFEDYCKNPNPETTLELNIKIINTSSTRRLVNIFKILDKLAQSGKKVNVVFIFLPDDEIMQYMAFEFSNAFNNINFKTQIQ